MSKLLPCPFCGGEARMWPSQTKADQDGSYEIIGCSNIECPIEPTTDDYLPYDEALKRWNTRPTPARCDELVTTSSISGTLLVTRQNAEAVIAAKDARIRELERRLKEVELEHTGVRNSYFAERRKASALEADNKRLREALSIFLGDATMEGLLWGDAKSTDLVTIRVQKKNYDFARAALGEVKP